MQTQLPGVYYNILANSLYNTVVKTSRNEMTSYLITPTAEVVTPQLHQPGYYAYCGAAMSPSLLTPAQARVHQLHRTVMLNTTNLLYLVTASTYTTHYKHIQELKKTLPSCFILLPDNY